MINEEENEENKEEENKNKIPNEKNKKKKKKKRQVIREGKEQTLIFPLLNKEYPTWHPHMMANTLPSPVIDFITGKK